MPPTKQRTHYVLARTPTSARPVMDTLLANGMLPDRVRWLDYSGELRRFKPEDVAFIFLADFKDHPRYVDCAVMVHGMIAMGAIVKPNPLMLIPADDLLVDPDKLRLSSAPPKETLQERTNRYGAAWEGIFKDVVTDKITKDVATGIMSDWPLTKMKQAAQDAVAAIDSTRGCDCYWCRFPRFAADEESAQEEPTEYMQVFLGGKYDGTLTDVLHGARNMITYFTDDEGKHTYKSYDAYVLGKMLTFWIHEDLWDDRQRLVREYLLEPLEA